MDKIFVCFKDSEMMRKWPKVPVWLIEPDSDLTMDAHFPQQWTSESAIPELTHKFYEAHKIYLTSRPVILSGWSHLDYHHSGRNTENRILRENMYSHIFTFLPNRLPDRLKVCVCQKMSKNAHNKSEAKQTPSAARWIFMLR